MAGVAFGRFALVDPRGDSVGDVIIAPECILLQRGPSGRIRDVSYLVLWSAPRIQKISDEIAELARLGTTTVDAHAPEVHAILRAIAPTAAGVFQRAGRCRRRFARASLKTELSRRDPSLAIEAPRKLAAASPRR